MRRLKYIGNNSEMWERNFTPGAIYEAYNSVMHDEREVVRNDYFVALELTSERLERFEEIE